MKRLFGKIGIGIVALALIFSAVLAVDMVTGSSVAASAKDAVCQGVGLTSGTSGCVDPIDGPNVDSTVRTVISLLSFAVGIVAVVMVIIAGLKYITSNGDSNQINSAKNTLLYAIVGLVIVALAQIIVRFVLNEVK